MSYGLQLNTTNGLREVGAISTIIFIGRVSTDNYAGSVPIPAGWWEGGGYFDILSPDYGPIRTGRVSGGSIIWERGVNNSVFVHVDFWAVGNLS